MATERTWKRCCTKSSRALRPVVSTPASRLRWSWSIRPPISLTLPRARWQSFSTYGAWTRSVPAFPIGRHSLSSSSRRLWSGLLERFVVRPVAARSVLSAVVIFIGLLVIFNSVAGWIWTYSVQMFPTFCLDDVFPGNKYITSHELGSLLVMLTELADFLYSFVLPASVLAMRAAAHNPISSRLVGVRVDPAGAGLGNCRGDSARLPDDDRPGRFPRSQLDVRNLALRVRRRAAWRYRLTGGAVVGGLLLGVLENLAVLTSSEPT